MRLWIPEDRWDALDETSRTKFEEPLGGVGAVDWEGREGWVTAMVPADEVLTALRGLASAAGIELHEGDAPPAKAPAKKARAKARPARLTAVPEADALCELGKVCIVGRDPDSRAWELFAADTKLSGESWTRALECYQRVRQYNRAGKCVRDLADEGGAP